MDVAATRTLTAARSRQPRYHPGFRYVFLGLPAVCGIGVYWFFTGRSLSVLHPTAA
jgi:hypothetical protein